MSGAEPDRADGVRLVLMGPPGAGKGTQGALLADRFGVPRYATGDILRAARREGTELGREARRYMDAGELVPDEVILGLIREALSSPGAAGGFLLDGFPRTLEQARELALMLEELEVALNGVIDLQVPDDEIVRRLSSRRVCADCGRVAPVDARAEADCPACGGETHRRPDDEPETVRHRLEVYRRQTEPVLAWYRRSGVPVYAIRGTGEVEEIQARVMEAIAA